MNRIWLRMSHVTGDMDLSRYWRSIGPWSKVRYKPSQGAPFLHLGLHFLVLPNLCELLIQNVFINLASIILLCERSLSVFFFWSKIRTWTFLLGHETQILLDFAAKWLNGLVSYCWFNPQPKRKDHSIAGTTIRQTTIENAYNTQVYWQYDKSGDKTFRCSTPSSVISHEQKSKFDQRPGLIERRGTSRGWRVSSCHKVIHLFAGRAVKRERRKGSSRRQQPAYGAAVNEVARELLRSARSPKRENGGRRYIKHDGMIASPVGSCLCCRQLPLSPPVPPLYCSAPHCPSLSPTRFDVFKDVIVWIVHNMLPILSEQPRHLGHRPVYVGFPYAL